MNGETDYMNVLTPSELKILKLVAEYKSSKEIADIALLTTLEPPQLKGHSILS